MVSHADGATKASVGANGLLEQCQTFVDDLCRGLGRPLERGVRFGDEPADADRAPDVLASRGLATGLDDVHGHVLDPQDVLVGLGGQPTHEVQLHLTPSVAEGRGHGVDEVLLGDLLVDDPAHPFRAALGSEGEPGSASVARELVGQVDVEGVDAGARQ